MLKYEPLHGVPGLREYLAAEDAALRYDALYEVAEKEVRAKLEAVELIQFFDDDQLLELVERVMGC